MTGVGQDEDERKNSTWSPCVPKRVRLLDVTSFVARYERISSSNLPGNIRVTRTRTVGPRNKRALRIKKKRVRFNLANTLTQDRGRRIKTKKGDYNLVKD